MPGVSINISQSVVPGIQPQIDSVIDMPAESPSGPPGSVQVVDFTLMGQPFQAISAGPLDPFNHAISLVVDLVTAMMHREGLSGSRATSAPTTSL